MVEPYQANVGLSVLRYKTGFVLISHVSIISHDLRHAENIIPHFFFNRKIILRYLSISGSRKHLISISALGTTEFCVSRVALLKLAKFHLIYITQILECGEDFKMLAGLCQEASVPSG